MAQSVFGRSPLFLSLLAAVAAPVLAQQPPDVVQSDVYGNTAMGSNALWLNTTSNANTAAGSNALFHNTTGSSNTAVGQTALTSNTTASANTAVGAQAMWANTTGYWNTAAGASALQNNTTGAANIAIGVNALAYNTAGSGNTAVGVSSLNVNTASNNTGLGADALFANTTGTGNTAAGGSALSSNTTGSSNSSCGYQALAFNTTGNNNAASGTNALLANSTGSNNTATGTDALYSNSAGSGNIAVGYESGYNLTGNNNIDIGNIGVAGENGVIRIGARTTQTQAYIGGIWGSRVTGSLAAVYVTPYGQLGVQLSSERYKTDVATMGSSTDKLDQLRPVTFRLKDEPQGEVRYGLIAEEVDKVYPELVIRGDNGSIEGVRYEELAPMLLNEVQQQQHALAAQQQRIEAQARQLETMQQHMAEVLELERSVRASLVKLPEPQVRPDQL